MDATHAAAAHAVRAIHDLPEQIARTQQALAGVNLGPFHIDVRCSHGFLGIYDEHYAVEVSFGGFHAILHDTLDWVGRQSAAFDPLYRPLAQWLCGPLQTLGAEMDALHRAAQALLHADAAAVAAVRTELAARVPRTVAQLQHSEQLLNDFDRELGAFMSRLGSRNQALKQTEQQLETHIDDAVADVTANIAGWACGGGQGLAQLGTWKAAFKASTGTIAANVNGLNHHTAQANAGLAQIIGEVSNIRSRLQNVGTQLEQADDAHLGNALKALRLDVACDLWSSLADAVAGGRGA